MQLIVPTSLLKKFTASKLYLRNSSFDCTFCCSISTVAVTQQKAQTVLWYAKFKSIVCVKYEFRYEYGVRPTDKKRFSRWYEHYGKKTFS